MTGTISKPEIRRVFSEINTLLRHQ